MTIEEFHRVLDGKPQDAKTNRKHTDPEHTLQVACVNWFRMQYPHLLIYAIPNGGQRNVITATKLKAEGATAGVPDLHIPIPRHGYASLYIEMKDGKRGRLSANQIEMADRLQGYGNKVVVCRTFEDFEREVKEYLVKREE